MFIKGRGGGIWSLNPGQVKSKTLELVCAASLLRTLHLGVIAQTVTESE